MRATTATFAEPAVAAKFAAYPPELRAKLLELRALIIKTAAETPDVGPLEETLKWDQPAYLTNETKSGTAIRVDALRGQADSYALYVHCQTDLVARIRRKFGERFRYEGNRALLFSTEEALPVAETRACIQMALTYHAAKRNPKAVSYV